jgi:hypothetical protein
MARMDQLADEIEKLVRTMPGLTGMDLVRMLHERARSPHQKLVALQARPNVKNFTIGSRLCRRATFHGLSISLTERAVSR